MNLRKYLPLFALASLCLLPACQSAPNLQPSPSNLTATPTAVPPPFFEPVQETPVFPRGPEGSWHQDNMEPGAIVHHDGLFHMFFNGIVSWPAKAAIGYATSPDGAAWTLAAANPILDSAAETFEGYTFFVSSAVPEADGTWTLYLYTLLEGRDGAGGSILRATSPHPAGPWTLAPAPVLSPGPADAWDASRVTQPSVLRTEDGYVMFYTGFDTDKLKSIRMIGMATSPDGVQWTKYDDPDTGGLQFADSDPVFGLGARGEWDGYRVFQPHVVRTADGYLMLYKANIQIGRAEAYGFAFSADGVQWTRYGGNPIIDEKTYPILWRRKGYTELVYHEGTLYLFLEILEREGGAYPQGNNATFSSIHLATHTGLPGE